MPVWLLARTASAMEQACDPLRWRHQCLAAGMPPASQRTATSRASNTLRSPDRVVPVNTPLFCFELSSVRSKSLFLAAASTYAATAAACSEQASWVSSGCSGATTM
jgi:hypothetical protein